MDNVFLILFFLSVIALIVGLIKPSMVIKWGEEKNVNRKNVLKYYGLSMVVFFILTGVFAKTPENEDIAKKTDNTTSQNEEKVKIKEEEEKFKILEEDKSFIVKNYADFTDLEKDRFDEIKDNLDLLDNNDKEYINSHLERLNTQEDEWNIYIAEEEARKEQEKYNSGISWHDLARDKDGLIGSYVTFSGKIVQVIEGKKSNQYRMAVNDDYDQMILIEINQNKLSSNLLEDDYITIEGMSVGNITYETIFGANTTIPGILVENVYF